MTHRLLVWTITVEQGSLMANEVALGNHAAVRIGARIWVAAALALLLIPPIAAGQLVITPPRVQPLAATGGATLPTPPRLTPPPLPAPSPVVIHVRLSRRVRAAMEAAPDDSPLVAHLLDAQGNTLATTPVRSGSTLIFLVEPSELPKVRMVRVRGHRRG